MSTLPIQPRPMLPDTIWQSEMLDPKTGLVNPTGVWGQQLQFLAITQNAVIGTSGTHAQRLATSAANYPAFSLFLETDRLLLYIAIGQQWVYFAGMLSVQQASLPTDLTANDYRLSVYVADFAHYLLWNGTGWQWASGESSGFSVPFVQPPNPLLGWQVCDGSTNIPTLNGDGSLSFATVPNVMGSYYRQ